MAYRVTELATTCVTMATRAAYDLWARPAPGPVDPGHAFEAFRSERHTRVLGASTGPLWAPLSGDHRAVDGWVRLHANYPHHAAAIHRALGPDPASAVARLPAIAVEDAVLAAGGAAAALRTRSDWLAAQGASVREEPLVALEKLGSAPASPRTGDSPLAGVRVLDLTHVIAGPVCGRVLAAHGADVLHVTPPDWPVLLDLVRDTDFGKRQCVTDLDGVRALAAEADVFVQSYRPGALGLRAADLAARRPGIVVVSLSAYGHTGPWRDRRGFDSLVQMSTGIAAGDPPRPLPAQALDHGTGWLAAYGAMTALSRGGSWHVHVSLARTAEWLHDLGDGDPVPEVDPAPWLTETDSDFGRLRHLRVPGATVEPAGPRHPGSDPAAWW
ncbi:CoA transferase [Actinophytocola glycyrrhizae]|uniref:CoA transferase n=1 Tax=Actinophytocola glycyrrhizae TaxID=2044873 RepID=A0ABV9SC83_9PSEU